VIAAAAHADSAAGATPETRACPACGAREARILSRYSTSRWQVTECSACKFVFLRNPPAYERLVEEFAWQKTKIVEQKRREEARPAVAKLDQSTRWRLGAFKQRRPDLYRSLFKPGRVLDVGCGQGREIPRPFVPYGIEISRSLYEKAAVNMAKRGGQAVHGAAADAIATFPDRYFTGVILSSVVEHEVRPMELLSHVARVLESDGKAFIRVPNFGSLNRVAAGSHWCGFRHPDHVNYFTTHSLRGMAAKAGLAVKLLNPIRTPFDDNINAVLTPMAKH
jgi:SAM-dependent methyltransferase